MSVHKSAIFLGARKIVDGDVKKLQSHYGLTLPNIDISISPTMTRFFGKACLFTDGTTLISLSKKIFAGKVNTQAFENTVRHELAHVAEYYIFGDMSDHDKHWMDIMSVLGAPTNVFVTDEALKEVNFDIPRRNLKKYEYSCQCRTVKVGGQVHNNIKKGKEYICQYCRTAIRGS